MIAEAASREWEPLLPGSASLFLAKSLWPIGTIHAALDALGRLVLLEFGEVDSEAIRRRFGKSASLQTRDVGVPEAALGRYFEGDLAAIDSLEVALGGTEFQRRCWTALRAIPAGKTWTYGEQARFICQPTAVRAVGRANGSNPIAIVVPCHRVIGANAQLTGYAGGLDRKAWLLAHEARHSRFALC